MSQKHPLGVEKVTCLVQFIFFKSNLWAGTIMQTWLSKYCPHTALWIIGTLVTQHIVSVTSDFNLYLQNGNN